MTESAAGPLIATGRSADIFDIGHGRVLRRYRDGRPAEWSAREAEVITHARAHGVPVPEVFDVSGTDIVMERVAGRTMLDVLAARELSDPHMSVAEAGRMRRALGRLSGAGHQTAPG